MSEKYKLGLTRNRLFAMESTVVFAAVSREAFDEKECAKAIRMLSAKEPIITGVIELDEDADAYLVVGRHEPMVTFSGEDSSVVTARYDREGIRFTERLFEFTVCRENTLVIGAHVAVCDSKSLLRLAKSFVEFYCHESISVEPSDVLTFPDSRSLPAKFNSPVIDKLSADLEGKWKRKNVRFSVEDYFCAAEKYSSEKSEIGMVSRVLSSGEKLALCDYCTANGVDLSSLVAYGIYDAVYGSVSVPKRARRLAAYSDRRFFLSCADNCSVGAFDGYVDVSLKAADAKKQSVERMKAFHLALYKGVTSPFRAFYDELLLMRLSPVYSDASHLSVAGAYSYSVASRLADNYGCNDARLMGLFSCNFTQEYWSGLSFFRWVTVRAPFVCRFVTMADVFIDCDGVRIDLRYDKGRVTDNLAEEIVEKAVKSILGFIK